MITGETMKSQVKSITDKIITHQKIGQKSIQDAIFDYCNNNLSDEEFLPIIKAIYDYGLCNQDLYFLTDAMMHSGQVLNLSELGKVIDKHSTGGVSDSTTLIIAPICACLGVKMLKMSGRALGFTGGTCDKIECFSGYKTDIELSKAIELVRQNGACIITSSMNIAPADKKIYALRDRTGLVDNIPLIASSIMSKKLASGADKIVLDVKYGNGAFMKNKKDAKLLAKKMKTLAKISGKKVKVVFGKMNEPLGYYIGSRLEAFEIIQVLNGQKSKLQRESIKLASNCVALYKNIPYLLAKWQVKRVLNSGKALEKFKQMILSQGGSLQLFNQQLPSANFVIKSDSDGKFMFVDTEKLGQIVADLTKKCGLIYTQQNFLGISTKHKNNDVIKKGEVLFSVFAPDQLIDQNLINQINLCYKIV